MFCNVWQLSIRERSLPMGFVGGQRCAAQCRICASVMMVIKMLQLTHYKHNDDGHQNETTYTLQTAINCGALWSCHKTLQCSCESKMMLQFGSMLSEQCSQLHLWLKMFTVALMAEWHFWGLALLWNLWRCSFLERMMQQLLIFFTNTWLDPLDQNASHTDQISNMSSVSFTNQFASGLVKLTTWCCFCCWRYSLTRICEPVSKENLKLQMSSSSEMLFSASETHDSTGVEPWRCSLCKIIHWGSKQFLKR